MSVEKIQHTKQDLLQFNVAQLLKDGAPEESKKYTIENAVLPIKKDGLVLTQPIRGTVKLAKAGADVWLKATLTTSLQLACTRCLSPVDAPVTVNIDETFIPVANLHGRKNPEADDKTIDPTVIIDETHILDLTEVLRQELYLSQPSQLLCKDDCLGLCPQCGHNLNEGPCDCEDTYIDPRWSVLLDK